MSNKTYIVKATKGTEKDTVDFMDVCPCCSGNHEGVVVSKGKNGGLFSHCPDNPNDIIYVRVY